MTKVIGDYTTAVSIDGSTNYLLIQPGSSSTAYNKINRNVFLGVTGQPMDISSSQNVTNKTLDNTNTITLKDTLFTLQDDGDATKQARFQLSGLTTATTRTYTLPNASSTLVDLSTIQTLTNKTLTSPTISGGNIDNTTITVDTISGHTVAGNGTVYGLSIHSGVLQTSNAVTTTTIANGAVTPDKLSSAAKVGTVLTQETTTSTSYVDLTTTTDTVTVTIGANGLAWINVSVQTFTNTNSQQTFTSFAASGANTIAAADTFAMIYGLPTTGAGESLSASFGRLFTGLTPGSTTFKMKYRTSSGTATFANRSITVIPL